MAGGSVLGASGQQPGGIRSQCQGWAWQLPGRRRVLPVPRASEQKPKTEVAAGLRAEEWGALGCGPPLDREGRGTSPAEVERAEGLGSPGERAERKKPQQQYGARAGALL